MSISSDAAALRTAVVMCTYNGERFVAEQIASVLAQTRLPDQLVVVDDGSSDGTWEIVQQLAGSAASAGIEVTLRRNARNLGYVANFEYALSIPDADLLFLSDQDDVWHREKLDRMTREFILRPELSLLHTDARLVDAAGQDMGHGLFEALEITADELMMEHAGRAFDVLLRRNVVTGATSAVRSGSLRAALPFPPHWVHDEWLAMSCSMTGRVDCLEEALIDYRQHDANQIGVQVRGKVQELRPRVSRRDLMRRIEKRLDAVLGTITRYGGVSGTASEAALRDRLRHARVRAHLPASAPVRIRTVLREARLGGYSRYSFGVRSIVADLLGLD